MPRSSLYRSFGGFLTVSVRISFVIPLVVIWMVLGLAPARAIAGEPAAVPGEYIVKYRSRFTQSSRQALNSRLGVTVVKTLSLTGAELTRSTNGASYDSAFAKELLASGDIEYIEPNYIYTVDVAPNDPSLASLWGLNNTGQDGGTANIDIDAPEAWDHTTGSSSVVVGIIDTGINYAHPDLAANMWVNTSEVAGDGVDNDGNGVVDDIYGYNAISNNGDPMDNNRHGSHCAGTIGGVGNNGKGVAGVNWNVKLMALKFLDASGSGTTQGAISAIEYAVMMKDRGVNIRVLSNSWGGGGYSQALGDAIATANDRGILFVAAAGNASSDNDSSPTYPANYDYPNVISVAAVDYNGNLASFSNYGATTVDLAAPGVNILSTVLGSDYQNLSGTSMATPHVSGVAALVLAADSSLSVSALRSRILQSSKPLSSLTNLVATGGMLNALNAITNTATPTPTPTPTVKYYKHSQDFSFDSNLGTRISTQDDAYITTSLGFTFPYYNNDYSQIVVSTNGRVVLGETPSSPDYSNSSGDGIKIYHTDLYPAASTTGGVWFKTSSNVATVTWSMTPYALRNSSSSDAPILVQLKLRSSGEVEFHYYDTYTGDNNSNYGAGSVVALIPPTGASGERLTVSQNTENVDELGNSKALRFSLSSDKAKKDFDGDGVSDLVVWRPSLGMWYILTSSSGFDFNSHISQQFGLPGDMPVADDYDGDGIADHAVWRPSNGSWYLRNSATQSVTEIQWGLQGDYPLPGDYDGDGRADLAVYRESQGLFYILLSSAGYSRQEALQGDRNAFTLFRAGGAGNNVLSCDFTGAGKSNVVTIWQLVRFWTIYDSSGQMIASQPWGEPGDTPSAGDYDGDNVCDRMISRVGSDYMLHHYTVFASGAVTVETFGSIGDKPVVGDYDGDGKADVTVFRPSSGEWFIKNSSDGATQSYQFGLPGDLAL